jgi:hypothetical protein
VTVPIGSARNVGTGVDPLAEVGALVGFGGTVAAAAATLAGEPPGAGEAAAGGEALEPAVPAGLVAAPVGLAGAVVGEDAAGLPVPVACAVVGLAGAALEALVAAELGCGAATTTVVGLATGGAVVGIAVGVAGAPAQAASNTVPASMEARNKALISPRLRAATHRHQPTFADRKTARL